MAPYFLFVWNPVSRGENWGRFNSIIGSACVNQLSKSVGDICKSISKESIDKWNSTTESAWPGLQNFSQYSMWTRVGNHFHAYVKIGGEGYTITNITTQCGWVGTMLGGFLWRVGKFVGPNPYSCPECAVDGEHFVTALELYHSGMWSRVGACFGHIVHAIQWQSYDETRPVGVLLWNYHGYPGTSCVNFQRLSSVINRPRATTRSHSQTTGILLSGFTHDGFYWMAVSKGQAIYQ